MTCPQLALAVVLAAGLGLLAEGPSWAQAPASVEAPVAPEEPAELVPGEPLAPSALAQAWRKNLRDLAPYRWKCRVELRLDGAVRGAQYFQVRSDAQGRRQGQLIGGEVTSGEGGPASRVVSGLADGAGREWAAPLKRLAERYVSLDPLWLQVGPETLAEPESGRSRLVLRGVLDPADTLVIETAPGSGRPLRLDVTSTWEGAAVEISIEFSELPDGPFYDARTSIRTTVEGRAVALLAENFDFGR